MAPQYTAPSLQDQPVAPMKEWKGYFRNTDPTILAPNCLTFPSINCFVPNMDKVVPRMGKTVLGQPYTEDKNWPVIGHKERFTTMGGYVLEVRVVKSDDANLKDIIEVLYPNPVTGEYQWYQITQNVNPLTAGVHEYYMDDWFDTNLNPAESLNLSRLIWVNGLKQIFSWTGGIAPIVAVINNVSISTTLGVTWTSLGFVSPALGGSGNVIINGVAYAVSGGWDTDTLLISNTSGISVNDVAFSQIQADTSQTAPDVPFDMCRQNKNYMFYGNWKSRKLYMSNGFNHNATQEITSAQAVQNDLVLSQDSPYTGTGSHVYRVTIDSVNPEANRQDFIPGGSGGLNDGRYNTSGYTDDDGSENVYKVVMVAEYTIVVPSSSGLQVGEIIQGNTSDALARVVVVYDAGSQDEIGVVLLQGQFEAGETITSLSSGVTTGASTVVTYQDWIQCYKNDSPRTITNGPQTGRTVALFNSAVINLVDGLTITFGNWFGHAVGDTFQLTIDIGGNDTFQWQIDGGTPTTGVAITGNPQTLSNGVEITFVSKTGHAVGDYWDITVDQEVDKAWTSFYYTLPVRKPGEGYVYQLPSNFWTMAPQEEEMYVNTAYGYWSYISTVLSADLQSETVSLTPLKQSSASKVIYPYMITHLDNDLIFVTENKKLDMIGRQQFLQLPQIGYLSQPIELDFIESTFFKGSMHYLDKRLYITSPGESVTLIYDNQADNKYWQPPQIISETGILSTFQNTLIAHSNLRNQTFNLFTGTKGDSTGREFVAYTVRARTAYASFGNRWKKKNSNRSFIEGYITGVPPLTLSIYSGIGGCGGISSHPVQPIVCILPDRAPLGEGGFGSHSFGSDQFNENPYFSEIYTKFSPILSFYFVALQLECTTLSHTYSLLSMGLNAVESNEGNSALIPEEVISRE